MHENGPENCPPGRCAICNEGDGRHRQWCKRHPSRLTHEAVAERALVTERGVPQTSAERYRELEVGSGDVCGPAAPPTPESRSTAISGVSGLDPVADARARAATEGLNPKDLVGASKTPLGLLPWTALVQVAKVFEVGAAKYGAYNWRTEGQPVQHVTYVAAAFRHLAAYMDGQTIDPETGCNHLAHAACGLLILLDASAVGNAIDNRPTPGVAAEIMALRR